MSSFEQKSEELLDELMAHCEEAFAQGITSVDIYEALHSHELFCTRKNNESAYTNTNHENEVNKNAYKDFTNNAVQYPPKSKNSSGFLLLPKVLKLLKKLVCLMLILGLLVITVHLGVCKLTRTNPLKFFPTLQEQRCLLPSHPLIMEMVRPVANCDICLPLRTLRKTSTSSRSSYFHSYISPDKHSIKKNYGQSSLIDDGDFEFEILERSASPVIELEGIPSKGFFQKIAYSSRPIIIRNGGRKNGIRIDKDDGDKRGFSFKRLKTIFESEVGGVDTVSNECQFLPFRSPFSSLREAFDLIDDDKATWDKPWYIGWSNCHPGVAGKLREIIPRPSFLPEDSESSAIDWIFIGSPGLGAAMHIDYVKRPSWQVQLSGVKTWYLQPPPECEELCPQTIAFTIYPGDLLFLETNSWYHRTYIEGDKLSISIGSEYD